MLRKIMSNPFKSSVIAGFNLIFAKFRYLFLLVVAVAGMVTCTEKVEEPFLKIAEEDTNIRFTSEAKDSIFVEVQTNRSFTAASEMDWCWVSVVKESNTPQLKIVVAKNNKEEDRSGYLTVSAEELPDIRIAVTQSFTEKITIAEADLNLEIPGDKPSVKIIEIKTTKNKPFTASTDADWLKLQVNDGSSLKYLIISASVIPGGGERTAHITVSSEGMENVDVLVKQNAYTTILSVPDYHKSFHFIGGLTATSVSASVTHNQAYTASSNQTWCTAEILPDKTSHQLKISVVKNMGAERTAEVTLSSSGAQDVKITVRQDAFVAAQGLPRFAVLSDVHFENNRGEGARVKVPKALKNLLKTPVDAVFVVGDITDGGTQVQYDQLISAFNNPQNVPAGTPVFYLMGNHDNMAGNLSESNYLNNTKQSLNQYVEIKGYPFITISQTGQGAGDYDHAAQSFLKESLVNAAANYPGKPIFVFVHVPPLNTVYGSSTSDGWGSSVFPPILEPYPQVIVFAGHSHYPLGDPRSIHQDKYTAVNDGSSTYSEIESGRVDEGYHPKNYEYVTEGLIVKVQDSGNAIEMERWDTYRNEEILPRWTVKAPFNGSNFPTEYKGRDGKPAPSFGENPQITVTTETNLTSVTFPQAIDNEAVHHYIIRILDATTNAQLKESKQFSQFYLNSEIPPFLTALFIGLPVGKPLKVEIIALDSYYTNQSAPITKEFSL
jgi:Icc-related predicted phosphoesterase